MNQHFCTYEQSLALKELGFDEPCFGTFMLDAANGKNPFTPSIDYCTKVQLDHGLAPKNSEYTVESQWVSAPLKSQAFAFFREKFKIDSFVKEVYKSTVKVGYYFSINQEGGIQFQMDFDDWHKTYSEAENACINKLIELAQAKQ